MAAHRPRPAARPMTRRGIGVRHVWLALLGLLAKARTRSGGGGEGWAPKEHRAQGRSHKG